jgi:hypothetical protein
VLWRGNRPVVEEIRTVARGLRLEIALLALGGVALAGVAWRFGVVRDRRPAMAASLAGFALLVSLSVDVTASRRVDPFKSGSNFIDRAAPIAARAEGICLYRFAFSGMYNLAFRRIELPLLLDNEQMIRALARPEKIAVVVRREDLYEQVGWPLPNAHLAATGFSGESVMDLITNWQPTNVAPLRMPASDRRRVIRGGEFAVPR